MSDNIENFKSASFLQNRVCSVAYTINDEQPVISTHIGDQPFFYMDEMDVVEDELLFDPAELGLLAEEIKILKDEIAEIESNSLSITEDTMKSFEDFADNAQSITEDLSLSNIESNQRLEEILNILSNSRLAAAYLNIAQKHEIKIAMSEQVERSFYDRRSGSILINPNIEINDQIILLSKELRRHWQHRQGALINPLLFYPDNAILINRAQEADLTVSMIRIAWELQLAGIKSVWERVENSPLSDLCRAYAREAFIDFRTINNGTASAAVFEAWFLSDRCRNQDKKIVQEMLADYNGYVFKNSDASKNITAELISSLGNMPFGKNYLSTHAHTIMEDPIFNEVRDRSSANFLWFIKFERTFKETEQHLQNESDLSTHDIRHDLLNKNGQDQKYDAQQQQKQSADVIQLFEYKSERQEQSSRNSLLSKSNPRSKNGAEIIDLKRWASKK